ncbi:MAG: holo-ACP synthase [Planctomycetaceae bacterium]|nr:holo-ACP synthase [Planctomycetaceae bacterium]MBN8603110.1 holo-ACP synthase [Planctomycetota bacterium]
MSSSDSASKRSRVIGLGTDIIECARIGEMIHKHGELFLNRVFTQHEIAYCSSRKTSNQHYAGRWAAKEAALKALGTGWAKGIQWTDIAVSHQLGGKPIITIDGVAAEIAKEQGIAEIMLSISHCRHYAVAYCIAVGD